MKYVKYLKLLIVDNCVKYLLLLNVCVINIQNVFKIKNFILGDFNWAPSIINIWGVKNTCYIGSLSYILVKLFLEF